MFQKICVFALVAGVSSACFADPYIPQVVTSEVFGDTVQTVSEQTYEPEPVEVYQEPYMEYEDYTEVAVNQDVPAWPLAGSDADVEIACGDAGCGNASTVVAKDGNGLVIQNNINTSGTGWTGGPNISNGIMVPAGYYNECTNREERHFMIG